MNGWKWGWMLFLMPVFIQASLQSAGLAESVESLSLHEAVERAMLKYPSLRVAGANENEARASLGVAIAERLPSLRLNTSATRFEEPMLVSPIHGFTPGQTPPFDLTLLKADLTLKYTIFDGRARPGRIKLAETRVGSALAGLRGARQDLMMKVISAYLEVLSGRQILQAHEHRLRALRSELARVRHGVDVGRSAQVAVLRVEASIANAEADEVRDAEALNRAERDLGRLVGASSAQIQASRLLEMRLLNADLMTRHHLIERAIQSNSTVEQARKDLAGAEAGVQIATGTWWPDLDLVGDYLFFGSAGGDYTEEWQAGLQLSYPLFTGGAQSQAIARAGAVSRAARERLNLVLLELEGEVDRALSAVAETHARVRSLETAVARFAEVARIEHLLLEAGTGTQTDYLNAEADLLSARANLAQARHGEITARAGLARVTGELDLDWLVRTLETQP